jgi:hypothetical protein
MQNKKVNKPFLQSTKASPTPFEKRGCIKHLPDRARTCKRLRSPGIDSKESIPPAYLAWRAGTSNGVVIPARQAENRFLGSLKGLQIRALDGAQDRELAANRSPRGCEKNALPSTLVYGEGGEGEEGIQHVRHARKL